MNHLASKLSIVSNSLAVLALSDGHKPTVLTTAKKTIERYYSSRREFELDYIRECGDSSILRAPFAGLLEELARMKEPPPYAPPETEESYCVAQELRRESLAEMTPAERRQLYTDRRDAASLERLMIMYWSL